MFDSYKHFLETPVYNKIIGNDYLIVEFKCPIEDELFAAWAECHSIVYVMSGQKKWITPKSEFLVKEDQSIFVRKGAFKNQQYFEEGFCVLMFFMKDSFIKRCIEEDIMAENIPLKQITHPNFVYRLNVSDSLKALYHSFFSYLRQEHKLSQKILELKFREMILNICSSHENTEIKDVFNTIARNVDNGSIQQIMEEQYPYNLKVDEYARLCGKSTSSFKRDFKKIYKATPGKWLMRKRLDLASNLILNTDSTIQEVCYDCGFESDSHFIRSFKNHFGLTPNHWRKSKMMAPKFPSN